MPLEDVILPGHGVIDSSELSVAFVRSSGPGGQHVNKTSTQAQVRWTPARSASLSDAQRQRIATRLKARLTTNGEMILSCDQHRSRERNLAEVIARLGRVVSAALQVPKTRRPTKPTKGSKRRRVESKKRRSETKKLRQKPE